MKSCVNAGEFVVKGQVIAELENFELGLQLAEKRNELALAKARMEVLSVRRASDRSASGVLQSTQQTVLGIEQELGLLVLSEKSLTIMATQDGYCMQPVLENDQKEGDLDIATPILSQENVGSFIKPGTLLGRLETSSKHTVHAYLTADSLEGVKPGQRVSLITRRSPDVLLYGQVARVAIEPSARLPAEFTGEKLGFFGYVAADGKVSSALYLVEIEVSSPVSVALHDGIGCVWIETPPISLGHAMYRSVLSNFRL